jgi:tRNA threonylcarbamoyl adenosine modification protein YeaZ
MYGLAIHTTSGELGLTIDDFTGNRRYAVWDLGRDLSSYLHQYLQEFLTPQTWSDLSFLAIAKGPGSFTSTRIGVVTGRTLAQQLQIPIYGISTLASLAWFLKDQYSSDTHLAISMTASRGQLFAGIYQFNQEHRNLTCHLFDTTLLPVQWQEILTNWKYPYQLIEAPLKLGQTSNSILDLGYLNYCQNQPGNYADLLPFYGQNLT